MVGFKTEVILEEKVPKKQYNSDLPPN